jgi:hypothetical protein
MKKISKNRRKGANSGVFDHGQMTLPWFLGLGTIHEYPFDVASRHNNCITGHVEWSQTWESMKKFIIL